MNVAKPFAVFSSGVGAEVLVALAGSTTPRSGRELAGRIGRSPTGVQHVLPQLVEHGLVNRLEAGRSYMYRLNRKHVLAPAVEQMAGVRSEFVRRLRRTLADWAVQPVSASLFGSAARGDGDERSDIDLFVVRPGSAGVDDHAWREQVDQLAESVRDWTGNYASIAEISEGELTQLLRDRPPVAEALRKDAIDLAGESTSGLLKGL
jgi:predicted nucleotidyltransferase